MNEDWADTFINLNFERNYKFASVLQEKKKIFFI